MNKKPSKYALIALFLALVVLFPVAGIVAGDRVKSRNLEFRTPSPKPALSLEHIADFPQAYEAWYADSQPFRDMLIYARARLTRALYDRDVTQMVAFGKQDWLFYTNKIDGNPLRSYRGEDLYTNMELRRIAEGLVQTRDSLRKQGCEFVLFIAPNKERVYSEYMPDRFGPPADNYGVKQLVRFLRQRTDLNVVYCCDDLMQAKQDLPDIPIYYSQDTHWNNVGSYVGARALMRTVGIDMPPLTRDMIRDANAVRMGDLSRLAHLERDYSGDKEYAVTFDAGLDDADKKVVFLCHDSFGDMLAGYLANYFSIGGNVSHDNYSQSQIDDAHPDLFILETVERYARLRLLRCPLYTDPGNR